MEKKPLVSGIYSMEPPMRGVKQELLDFLQLWKPVAGTMFDKVLRRLGKNGKFSVKSLYKVLNTGGYWSPTAKVVWRAKVLVKVRAFL